MNEFLRAQYDLGLAWVHFEPAWGASEVRPFRAIRTWARGFYE